MAWAHARCKCGDVLTQYSSGWRHNDTYQFLCPDGTEAFPVEQLIECIRYVTPEEYERINA